MADAGLLAPTLALTVRSGAGEKYDRITDYELGAKPEWEGMEIAEPDRAPPELQVADDDIPF